MNEKQLTMREAGLVAEEIRHSIELTLEPNSMYETFWLQKIKMWPHALAAWIFSWQQLQDKKYEVDLTLRIAGYDKSRFTMYEESIEGTVKKIDAEIRIAHIMVK